LPFLAELGRQLLNFNNWGRFRSTLWKQPIA
jgi:hypothetical protein